MAQRSSSSPRRRKNATEYIAPGFSTAAEAERVEAVEQAELTEVAAPEPRSAFAQAIAAAFTVLDSVLAWPFWVVLQVFEVFYRGVQMLLVPVFKVVPRSYFGIELVTANMITFSRVFLVIPVAIGLSYGSEPLLPEGVEIPGLAWATPDGATPVGRVPGVVLACVLILWHDFLDHLDGIVAVAQRESGAGSGDDPMFGGFIDAFIDKVFFAIAVWSTLLCSNLAGFRSAASAAIGLVAGASAAPIDTESLFREGFVVSACAVLVAYEVAIATVRVNDYFTEKLAPPAEAGRRRVLRAAMEGKLKQKLTSFGLAVLALAVPDLAAGYAIPGAAWVGAGLLWLACFMAHKSLAIKLAAYPGWEGFLPAGAGSPM